MARIRSIALVLVCLTTPVFGANILIYGPSMDSSTPNEQTVAVAEGHTVTVVEDAAWSALTQEAFDAFDAIVFGDNGCGDDYSVFDTANSNKSVWGPVVTGNVVVHTFDPFAHESAAGAIPLVENGINWAAAAGSGRTGLYLATGCYPESTPETLDFMSTFGTFITADVSGDTVTVEDAAHPVLAGISEADLEGWSSSWHGRLTTYPESFQLIASDAGEALIVARAAIGGLPADVPALSPSALALLGLALGVAALIALRR